VDVSVTSGTPNPKWPLFPYTPYPQQLRFMRDVHDCLDRRGILVVEACNGFGKTVSSLASLLPLAEGSNFPDEATRGVVLIGVPYADFSDPVVRVQIRYFDSKRRGMGNRWYVMDAFRAANQAMGQCIRHRDDWCTFVLMDTRYGSHRDLISRAPSGCADHGSTGRVCARGDSPRRGRGPVRDPVEPS
jgi:Rad3-related DNA helicase